MIWSKLGRSRAIEAAYCANCDCAVVSSRVVRSPTY
jgi:hypothetical protein